MNAINNGFFLDIIGINGFCCLEIGDVWDLKKVLRSSWSGIWLMGWTDWILNYLVTLECTEAYEDTHWESLNCLMMETVKSN